MSITVYGLPLESGDLSSATVTQEFSPQQNYTISGVALELILFNSPVVTNLRAVIYDNNSLDDSPSSVRATSTNAWNSADLLSTEAYGLKIVPFSFVQFGVRSGDKYHLGLKADSYTATGSSYIAWRNAWPEPAYSTNFTVNGLNYLSAPRMINGFFGRTAS